MVHCFILLNHPPATEQLEELLSGFSAIPVLPPLALKDAWAVISPQGKLDEAILSQFTAWIEGAAGPGDILWAQGEYGATFYLAAWAQKRGLRALYATTRRESIEERQPDGSVVKKNVFRHVQFREYPMISGDGQ